eukprot:TRINITY_DN3556_c0_g1_i3.p3 TRINITY_DN3556_c0_g1~~TRINITY_DN3556_c0_g1_i3.p3  ORF type:complete len:112 (+),score=66.81 TRINITY_DN3556_c0_g1_i3:50-385(+)
MAKHGQETAAFGKAMDVAEDEEKEVKVDAKAIEQAFIRLRESQEKANAKKREAAKELAKIKVEKADVVLVQDQLGLKKDEAEVLLKQSGGDVRKCFVAYINQPPAEPVPLV